MSDRITAEQAAKRLGITTRTLWRWRDAGKISEAPRTGNVVMFYAKDVDALRGVEVEDVTIEDVYTRLVAADSWEDIDALKTDIAAMLCTHAAGDGRDALTQSWRAACAMAATHPDTEAQGNWARTARQYGRWLGLDAGETDALIARRRTLPYEKAVSEFEAAPRDPAIAIIKTSYVC